MLRNKETRKVLLAVAASLFLHFAVGLSLASFGGGTAQLPAVEDKPPELTLIDAPSAVPTPTPNPSYMETDDSKRSAEKPKEETFESNANSVAASEKTTSGEDPLPSQDGKDRPFVNLTTQNLALATDGSKPVPQQKSTPAPEPQPSATASATPRSNNTPSPQVTPPPDQLALLTSTPPPAFTPPEDAATPPPPPETNLPPVPRPRPERPDSSFQAAKEQTRVTGRITNHGRSAVNAVETPLGRYNKVVSDAIGSRWYKYVQSKIDLVSIGTAHVEAQVDANGKIVNLKLLSNSANEAFANICLQSFQEAQIPPVPEELIATLPDGKLPVDITFTMDGTR